MEQVSARDLAAWLADASRPSPVLLDVREAWEFDTCHINGAVLVPVSLISARIGDFDADAAIVCICHHGARSMQVAAYLECNGFSDVANLTGGIHAWALQVDPVMAQY